MAYIYLGLAILFEVAGTAALKLSDGFTKIAPATVTIIGYGASFYLLALALKSLNVGYTYAIWSGIGIVLISIIGVLFMNEKIDGAGAIGIGLIVTGVFVLSAFSEMGNH